MVEVAVYWSATDTLLAVVVIRPIDKGSYWQI